MVLIASCPGGRQAPILDKPSMKEALRTEYVTYQCLVSNQNITVNTENCKIIIVNILCHTQSAYSKMLKLKIQVSKLHMDAKITI